MKKITDLMMELNEIDFDSHGAYKRYKAKHKMRPTTKVSIGGKETTAADADKVIKKADSVKRGAPKTDTKALDKLAKVGMEKPKAYEPPKKADGSVDWDAIANDPSNVHAKGSPQAGEDDDYFGDGDDTGERGTGNVISDPDDLYDKVRDLSGEEYNNLAHEYDIDPEDTEARRRRGRSWIYRRLRSSTTSWR